MKPEEKLFLRSLLYPVRWPATVCSFLRYVWQMARIRLYSRIKPAHVWTKERPAWLPLNRSAGMSEEERPAFRGAGMPSAPAPDPALNAVLPLCEEMIRKTLEQWPPHDPERYWHIHRWGWLREWHREGGVSTEGALAWMTWWVTRHTDRRDAAWEPFSCSERIANIFYLLMTMTEAQRRMILSGPLGTFILDSARWIISRVEYYGTARTNNHILNNGRALVIAGMLTGNRSILDAGTAIFRHMLPLLVSESGFLRERSSHYQLLVFLWLIEADRALALDTTFSASQDRDVLRLYLDRLASACSYLCDARGGLKSCVGDVSPDASPSQVCRWLQELRPGWVPARAGDRFAYAADGWFFIKQGEGELLTHQPACYPVPCSNHGHGDLTGFSFLYAGSPVLIDPGRNTYTRDPRSRLFTGGVFHNVPFIDGMPPTASPFLKKWVPEPYGSVRIDAALAGVDALSIEHDGFSRLGARIRHTRRISLSAGKLTVIDEFSGADRHELSLHWHFAPGFNLDADSAGFVRLVSPACVVLMATSASDARQTVPCSAVFHVASQDGGWYSSRYGKIEPSLSAHVSGMYTFPVVITTTFEVSRCL